MRSLLVALLLLSGNSAVAESDNALAKKMIGTWMGTFEFVESEDHTGGGPDALPGAPCELSFVLPKSIPITFKIKRTAPVTKFKIERRLELKDGSKRKHIATNIGERFLLRFNHSQANKPRKKDFQFHSYQFDEFFPDANGISASVDFNISENYASGSRGSKQAYCIHSYKGLFQKQL